MPNRYESGPELSWPKGDIPFSQDGGAPGCVVGPPRQQPVGHNSQWLSTVGSKHRSPYDLVPI